MQVKAFTAFVSAFALSTAVLLAHDYDSNKPVTLTGSVKKVEWHQPYVKIHMDVNDANGKVKDWEIETSAPTKLESDGVTSTAIKVGDNITVQGIQEKHGTEHALARSITLANGQTVSLSAPPVTSPPEPAQTAANTPPAPENLPRTASSMPLIGLIGLGALGAWGVLALRSRLLS